MNTGILPNMIPMRDINTISIGMPGTPGSPGNRGMTFEEHQEFELEFKRKQLLKERKKKLNKIKNKYEKNYKFLW